jgi:hypothetical protein
MGSTPAGAYWATDEARDWRAACTLSIRAGRGVSADSYRRKVKRPCNSRRHCGDDQTTETIRDSGSGSLERQRSARPGTSDRGQAVQARRSARRLDGQLRRGDVRRGVTRNGRRLLGGRQRPASCGVPARGDPAAVQGCSVALILVNCQRDAGRRVLTAGCVGTPRPALSAHPMGRTRSCSDSRQSLHPVAEVDGRGYPMKDD